VRIEYMQAEARALLVRAGAMLAFQFVVMLDRTFNQLPDSSKLVHMGGLALITLTVISLVMPAAHRTPISGKDSEVVRRIGVWFGLAATALGLGVGADTYVAMTRAIGSATAGLGAAIVVVLMLATLWLAAPRPPRGTRAALNR
jgi:hypothetical protein